MKKFLIKTAKVIFVIAGLALATIAVVCVAYSIYMLPTLD